jgi:hypothetical protein
MDKRGVVLLFASVALHAGVAAAASAKELWPFRQLVQQVAMGRAVGVLVPPEQPEPEEGPPHVTEEPEPVAPSRTVEWLGVIRSHRCSPFTYGGEEGREVPNSCPSRPLGTQCIFTAAPGLYEGVELCDVMLRCGDEVLYKSGSAPCRVRERVKPGASGPLWDLVIERDRGGSCNGGRSIRVDTTTGRIVWGIDNSYGGPEIEVEGVTVALTTRGLDSDAAAEPW